MKHLLRFLVLITLASSLTLGRAQATSTPGYKVVVEITFDEQGVPENGKVVQSDDPSGDQILNQISLRLAEEIKQEPRLDKDGKPKKFKARAPFNFSVEDDEGPEANNAPKPSVRSAVQPAYPENLAAAGEIGGAILELVIGADGAVKQATVLRSSHPEFANAAHAAVKQWQFTPAQKDGVAVESRWRIAVNFSLDGQEVEWKWRVAPRPSLGSHTVGRITKVPAAPTTAPAAEAVPAEKK